jgi:hypothetical protein
VRRAPPAPEKKAQRMNDIPNPDDHLEPHKPQRLSVGDPVLGKTRLLAHECAACIFRPGNLMHLAPGRLRQMVTEARQESGYIICRSTLPYHHDGAQPAICRGFADRYTTWQLQVIGRLWGFVEVEPPAPHTQPGATAAE